MPEKVTVDDPALQVLTDFKRVTAIIVLAGDTVDEAHSRMIKRGVRLLLLVVDQERKVVGLITANDILGEKPMQVCADFFRYRGHDRALSPGKPPLSN